MKTLNRAIVGNINCVSYGRNPGEWYFSVEPTDLDLGYHDPESYKTGHALRFLNIDIPPGQVIRNAYITYHAWGTRYGDDCNGYIYGEKSLLPFAFTTWANFEARPKTTNRIPWDKIPHWTHLDPYRTPNIAPIIQEIITQPGWVSGNPIALFIDDLEDRSSHVTLANRHAWSYYEHFEWTPVLTIEYGPETNFAVLDISYLPTIDSVIITLPTQIPCHLTCYYTDKRPVRHATSRIVRGEALPWGAYWCFVAWKSVEQQEAGDTLTHTFEVLDWSYCQVKWFTFRGTSIDVISPSVGPLFEYHHPGALTTIDLGVSQKAYYRVARSASPTTPVEIYNLAHDQEQADSYWEGIIQYGQRLKQNGAYAYAMLRRTAILFHTGILPPCTLLQAVLRLDIRKVTPPGDYDANWYWYLKVRAGQDLNAEITHGNLINYSKILALGTEIASKWANYLPDPGNQDYWYIEVPLEFINLDGFTVITSLTAKDETRTPPEENTIEEALFIADSFSTLHIAYYKH